MEWRDEGILLATRRHGESGAILEVFTARHGRHFGLMRGGGSSKQTAALQPGAQLSVTWRARLEDHLGTFRAEPAAMRAALLLDRPMALAALSAAVALLSRALPERDPQPALYAETLALFDAFSDDAAWPGLYAAWELRLLETLGVGLDLSSCAATGVTQELIHVSPRSGRAVSRAAGAPYADKLLPLPAFLRLGGPAEPDAFAAALRLTGYFLGKYAADALSPGGGVSGAEDGPPAARKRLQRLAEAAAVSDPSSTDGSDRTSRT